MVGEYSKLNVFTLSLLTSGPKLRFRSLQTPGDMPMNVSSSGPLVKQLISFSVSSNMISSYSIRP